MTLKQELEREIQITWATQDDKLMRQAYHKLADILCPGLSQTEKSGIVIKMMQNSGYSQESVLISGETELNKYLLHSQLTKIRKQFQYILLIALLIIIFMKGFINSLIWE